MSGALPRIIDLLTSRGFVIVAARGISLTVEKIDDLYTDPAPRPHPEGAQSGGVPMPLRLFGELYRISPGCLLLLHRVEGLAVDTMLKCKGYTRPERADAGSIRHMGENVFLNFSHCPDSPDAVQRELPILLGERDFQSLSAITEAGSLEIEDLIGISAFTDSQPTAGSWDAASFPSISIRICLRVISLLAALLRESDMELERLRAAKLALLRERKMLLATQTSRERLMAVQKSVPATIGIIRQLAASAHEDSIASGLDALAGLYLLDGPRGGGQVLALADRGVLISPLERIVLESHDFTFRPHPDFIGLYD